MDLVDALIAKHRDRPDVHVTRVLGAFVVVAGGAIVEVDRTHALKSCPLQSLLSTACIEDYVREKMERFGHFTSARELVRDDIAVPFGASEMMMAALQAGSIDCAITVCDGAGTVVTDTPAVVQGIGARMNGLFYTSPIPDVLGQLRQRGCTVFADAAIDQVRGLEAAAEAGYQRIAVTVNVRYGASFGALEACAQEAGVSVVLLGICATGATEARAREAVAGSDLAWSCASGPLRRLSDRARLQITHGIPIFVYTQTGLDFIADYADEAGAKTLRSLDPDRHYLLATGTGETPVTLGRRRLYLQASALPVAGRNAPEPLE